MFHGPPTTRHHGDQKCDVRGYYSFVEDFRRNQLSTTKVRKAVFGNGWVQSAAGEWVSLSQARFTADANPVLNIDAGPAGSRFFLATGGDTTNTTTNLRETITLKIEQPQRPTDLPDVK